MERGRPSTYSADVATEICARMAEGESLNEVCRSDGMPPASTVRRWVIDNPDGFAARYVRARELQAEHWADQIVDISDDGTNDYIRRLGRDGGEEMVADHDHIARSRLRVDSRKWLLSKLRPGTYGDKLQHANAAGNGDQEVVYRWAGPTDK